MTTQRSAGRGEDAVAYTLTRKRVKNINIRVGPDGTVAVSAPDYVPFGEVDRVVASRLEWIRQVRLKLAQRPKETDVSPDRWTDEECLAYFSGISDEIYLLVKDFAGSKPQLRVKWMKSRWGVCYVQKHCIVLNKRLMNMPRIAVEYVILHEYVHFLHPDHQSGFHGTMERLMPDYRQRRLLLREGRH